MALLKVKLYQTKNQLKNYTSQLSQNLKSVKYNHFLKSIFGGALLADKHLISQYNKGFCFLRFMFAIYSKYTWDVLLKDKKGNADNNKYFSKNFRWP